MKLHDFRQAPNPRRVRIFIAEKGMEIPTVQVDFAKMEQQSEAFQKLNPWCTAPVLELDDGTCISECMAICRYLEEIHPTPPLMGMDAKDKGVVAMWEHRFEADGMGATRDVRRNSLPQLAGRALSGLARVEQIPQLAERGRGQVQRLFAALDRRLADSEFVAGGRYTVADITAQVAVDVAIGLQLEIPPGLSHVRRWHQTVGERPSAQA